jgi:hypothetical protein
MEDLCIVHASSTVGSTPHHHAPASHAHARAAAPAAAL